MITGIVRPVVSSLKSNRLRSALSVLGIGIGIAAVICTAALGAGAEGRVQAQIDALGEDFIWIRPGSQNAGGVRTGAGTGRTLTVEDAAALDDLPDIAACSPVVSGREQVLTRGQNWNTRYQGVLPSYFDVRRRTLSAGSLFVNADVNGASRVLVLGASVATRLFEDRNPIDQVVRMGRFQFRVIGVLSTRGADRAGVDRDDVVFTPLTTALRNLDRRDSVSDIMCGVVAPERTGWAEAQAVDLLRWRHGLVAGEPDDFQIQRPIEAIETRAAATETMAMLLTGIGAVSLVVGGVGIMNIMLVSVTERKREIGVRLAIGARVRDIRAQFLAEAAALGFGGAACGIVLGSLAASAVSVLFGWPTSVSVDIVASGTGVAIGAGLLFGYYPAHLASRLDPIDAIRSET